MDLVVLYSESHTLNGCDRVSLDGDTVLVQGQAGTYPDGSSFRVPDGETLTAIPVERFLAAADELRARLGRA